MKLPGAAGEDCRATAQARASCSACLACFACLVCCLAPSLACSAHSACGTATSLPLGRHAGAPRQRYCVRNAHSPIGAYSPAPEKHVPISQTPDQSAKRLTNAHFWPTPRLDVITLSFRKDAASEPYSTYLMQQMLIQSRVTSVPPQVITRDTEGPLTRAELD